MPIKIIASLGTETNLTSLEHSHRGKREKEKKKERKKKKPLPI